MPSPASTLGQIDRHLQFRRGSEPWHDFLNYAMRGYIYSMVWPFFPQKEIRRLRHDTTSNPLGAALRISATANETEVAALPSTLIDHLV